MVPVTFPFMSFCTYRIHRKSNKQISMQYEKDYLG